MITIRQIERLWEAKSYAKLLRELAVGRAEFSDRLVLALGRAVPVAAMAVIRLDELSQAYVPACARFIRVILAAQDSDGGWGDPMQTALCLRALMCCNGDGRAVERGLLYLAQLQKTPNIWPKIPIRRTDEDAFTSAFILHQLGDQPAFRAAVEFGGAVRWFVEHERELDEETRKLWERGKVKCGVGARGVGGKAGRELVWS